MDEARFEQAVEFAKGWLRTPAEGFKLLGPGQRAVILEIDIALSRDSRESWDGCAEIARDLLREGERLPEALASWVADVLNDQRPRPLKRDEPMPVRSLFPGLVVGVASRYGLSRTRGVNGIEECCAEGGSAVDIVGAAYGIVDYKTAEQIWTRRIDFRHSTKNVG